MTGTIKRYDDTGWIPATLSSNFQLHPAERFMGYRKVNGIVYIAGIVSPKSTLAASDTTYTIFTLPEGFRPETRYVGLGHGSSTYHWLFQVQSNGVVEYSRYTNGTDYAQCPAGAMLAFSTQFIAAGG